MIGVAKDSHVPIGTRARAAKDAMGDKMDESRHGVSFLHLSSPEKRGKGKVVLIIGGKLDKGGALQGEEIELSGWAARGDGGGAGPWCAWATI